LTLTKSAQTTWLDATTSWSVNNPITSGTQRWDAASGTTGTITAAVTIAPSYYHQYQFTLSYSVTGGGTGYSAPTLTATQFGSSYKPTLSTTATQYWLDAGSSWSVTNPLTGSSSSERWDTSQTTSGTVSAAQTTVFTYYNQYSLTVTATSGYTGGTFKITYTQFGTTYTNQQQTTTWSSWADASTTATASSPQSPYKGQSFLSYSPSSGSVTMNQAQTITLNY
jgi:uncharacterized membrane protein